MSLLSESKTRVRSILDDEQHQVLLYVVILSCQARTRPDQRQGFGYVQSYTVSGQMADDRWDA